MIPVGHAGATLTLWLKGDKDCLEENNAKVFLSNIRAFYETVLKKGTLAEAAFEGEPLKVRPELPSRGDC